MLTTHLGRRVLGHAPAQVALNNADAPRLAELDEAGEDLPSAGAARATLRTSTSRSENMSANVDDTNTRTTRQSLRPTLGTSGTAAVPAHCASMAAHAAATATSAVSRDQTTHRPRRWL
jgi:hypothetical protein